MHHLTALHRTAPHRTALHHTAPHMQSTLSPCDVAGVCSLLSPCPLRPCMQVGLRYSSPHGTAGAIFQQLHRPTLDAVWLVSTP